MLTFEEAAKMRAAADLLSRVAEDLSRSLQSLCDQWLLSGEGKRVEAWELYADVQGVLTYLDEAENALGRLRTHRHSLEATADAGCDEFHKRQPKIPRNWY